MSLAASQPSIFETSAAWVTSPVLGAAALVVGLVIVFAAMRLGRRLRLAWRRSRLPAPDATGLIRHLDVAYVRGAEAHPVRHRLDVFAPANAENLPVLVFVHGGGWTIGHKSSALLGVYNKVGETFARLGMVVVIANYRLWPTVRHPEHIRDVAQAFAWARDNAAIYGGDPDNMFVGGHSAGGHLAALLATAPDYLAEHGLRLSQLRGCVSVSGVYRIGNFVDRLAKVPGIRYLGALGPIFSGDPARRNEASPIEHLSAQTPPFLVIYADSEWFNLGRQAEEFLAAAAAARVQVEPVLVHNRNHMTIMSRARRAEDPVVQAVAAFVERHGKRRLLRKVKS